MIEIKKLRVQTRALAVGSSNARLVVSYQTESGDWWELPSIAFIATVTDIDETVNFEYGNPTVACQIREEQ